MTNLERLNAIDARYHSPSGIPLDQAAGALDWLINTLRTRLLEKEATMNSTQTQAANSAANNTVAAFTAAGFDFNKIMALFAWAAANAKAIQDLIAIFNPPAGAAKP